PYFVNGDLKFNISHSGEIVVCAMTTICDIGVDIEKICPIDWTDFVFQMTESEFEIINTSKNSLGAFFNYWTQKEAIIKAHGNGLSIPLKSFEIHNDKATIESDFFFLKELYIAESYKCYIAFKNKNMNDFLK